MLRKFHVDVEFFYSFHLLLQIWCQTFLFQHDLEFDVEDFCLGSMFQRFLHDVRLKALSLVNVQTTFFFI